MQKNKVNSNCLLEWKTDWQKQSILYKLGPIFLVVAYILLFYFTKFLRSDHFTITIIALILWYAGPKLREIFRFMLPLICVFVVYDSQRLYSDYIRGTIRVTEPYNFDKFFFGINTTNGVLTPNEWWQLHTHWFLDLYTGFLYLTFITIYVLICAYFCFYLPRKGTAKRTPAWIKQQQYTPMWAFFAVNVIGYSTYYWYPAAPPWYVAAYGLGPADLSVAASAAGCLRFDALLGTHFFTGMYGRSADVFGAIPSLHVAYPLQAVYYAFRYGSLRVFTVLFYLSMCFSAVYLDHHYILDILWGSAYAILVCVAFDLVNRKRQIK